jgi:hypothetical protein
MADHRTLFNNKMAENEVVKGLSSTHLSEQEHNKIVLRLQQLQNLGEKRCAKDYRLLNKYQIKKISLGGIEVTRLVKRGSSPAQKFLVHAEMFDAI